MPDKTDDELFDEQGKVEQLLRERAIADLQRVLSQPEGRRVLHRIIYDASLGGLDEVLVDDPSTNAVLFHQGARAVGKQLHLDCMTSSPRRTKQMLKEFLDE